MSRGAVNSASCQMITLFTVSGRIAHTMISARLFFTPPAYFTRFYLRLTFACFRGLIPVSVTDVVIVVVHIPWAKLIMA